MICKLLGEIDSRVKKVKELPTENEQVICVLLM